MKWKRENGKRKREIRSALARPSYKEWQRVDHGSVESLRFAQDHTFLGFWLHINGESVASSEFPRKQIPRFAGNDKFKESSVSFCLAEIQADVKLPLEQFGAALGIA